jgi:L-alanine-DL-glutamate epimerase-like enolase superfamily enzyme
MKIIDILTYPVNLAGKHVFVTVLTDEHLYGIGEAYRVGPDVAVDRVIHYFKEWLIAQKRKDRQCAPPAAEGGRMSERALIQ